MSKMFPIPPVAFKPISTGWAPRENSEFENVFDADLRTTEERRRDPSFYFVRPDDEPWAVEVCSVLTHAEVAALAKAGVLRAHVIAYEDGTLGVNEHVLHAYRDFCRDVSDAWRRYQARLDRVPLVNEARGEMRKR